MKKRKTNEAHHLLPACDIGLILAALIVLEGDSPGSELLWKRGAFIA
jgi:hypothetical protein